MTRESNGKLLLFLNNKILSLLEKAKVSQNPKIADVIADLKNRQTLCDYVLDNEIGNKRRNTLRFSKNDSTITVHCGDFDTKKRKWTTRPLIDIAFSNISSSRFYIASYPQLVYLIFENASQIETECYKLKADLEKQEKIAQLAKSSILVWLETVMKNSGYQYYITQDTHKITLSIKMKHGMQLDIPIYFRRFQKQMPDLLETIKEYENIIVNRKHKVLISNLKSQKQWKTGQ
ncbi:MAG: hypothetical protein LBC89_00090 [Bacteroidales bacterium]|jgi:hypothetical protein|nr:hypothetical protein [Bacteroidales bacterium]